MSLIIEYGSWMYDIYQTSLSNKYTMCMPIYLELRDTIRPMHLSTIIPSKEVSAIALDR